ncbi:DUF982 domain-containing protein [Bosea sp. (in: a-proteobacteria)]|uniref:DUF982 domain-containing protein n=1 Tax=Bosea sp. (in: a-proteobacteria) TaxID=1871050 RepID=UPI0025BE1215|nr:DUF982 domain-containing protein [Bosea sp. (in: a-proteobacteria)]
MILTGLGVPRIVASVAEAYQFLIDWPGFARDAAHAFALKACQAALAGEIEIETARGVFVALAEKHDLLAPEMKAIVAFRKRRTSDPHAGE